MMYPWIVFLHVLAALLFFLAHGASMAMSMQLRREHDLTRIRAIFELSTTMLPMTYGSFLLLLIAGIIAGIMGNWFSRGWIWTALILLVVLMVSAYMYSVRFYRPIRKAIGLPHRLRQGEHPPETPASESEIAALIQATNPGLLIGVSFLLIAVILWLMMFKPF